MSGGRCRERCVSICTFVLVIRNKKRGHAFVGGPLPRALRQYLYFCTSKASKQRKKKRACICRGAAKAPRLRCQCLHFCTSKASNVSTCRERPRHLKPRAVFPCIPRLPCSLHLQVVSRLKPLYTGSLRLHTPVPQGLIHQ